MENQLDGKRFPPKLLYKYREVNDYGLRLLEQGELYFSDPVRDFNDPFDCQLPFNFRANKTDVWRFLTAAASRQHVYFEIDDAEAKVNWIHENAMSDTPDWKTEEAELTELMLTIPHENGTPKRIGVCSLSETRDDILMFTHYADGHKGFCIGIETGTNRKFFYDKRGRFLRHVDYVSEYSPPLFFTPHTEEKLIWKMFTKSAKWSYENEWRIVDYIEGSGIKRLPKANIREVIIGCRMPDVDKERVKRIAAQRRPKVQVLECVKARGRIGLELKEITT